MNALDKSHDPPLTSTHVIEIDALAGEHGVIRGVINKDARKIRVYSMERRQVANDACTNRRCRGREQHQGREGYGVYQHE